MPAPHEYCFGPFRVDAANARLLRGQKSIPLQPKAFDVLAILLENAGRLVPQQEMIDAVWPDTIVGDSSLKSCIRQIRHALGDGARQPQFIETVHRRGYRFIATVSSAQDSNSVPRRSVPEVPQAPALLVGREAELKQLHAWLAQAVSGQRQLVFLTGGPGSGKTALLEAFERQVAAQPQVSIASGQCFEQFGSGEAYSPVLEAISQLAHAAGGDRLLSLLAAHAPTWLAELPGLRQRMAADTTVTDASSATPERMLREMAETLEALTAQTPLVLVLEDLHWSDYSTLDLVSSLARRRHSAGLLVLATYRPVEAILSGHPLRAVKQDLQARGLCHELPVGLLDRPAVKDYLAARFPGGRVPKEVARLLHDRTEGNPLFLVNLVDYWLAQGALDPHTGELSADLHALDEGVPVSIRALIEKQLERLTAGELLVLEGASIAGVEFSAAAAAAAAESDVFHAEDCCERLVREHHLLAPKGVSDWPDGTASARYRFGHELYHRVVYERVTLARRRRLHERLGERLEAAHFSQTDDITAELALHFEQARDSARAARYLGQAADRATRHFAHREAIVYLRRALAVVERLDASERIPQELRLQVGLGLQLQITRGFASPEARDASARARDLCRHVTETTLLFPALWGLWLFHKARSELARAREMADELASLARQRGDVALQLQSHQALAVTTLCLGQPALTVQHMTAGTALYDPTRHHAQTFLFGQDPGVACLAFGAVALWLLGYPQQAVERSQEALRLSRQFSQPSTQVLALHFAAMLHQCRRDSRAALACADLALRIATDQGFSFWHAGGTVLRGWALASGGSAAEGLALLKEGLDAWSATGSLTYQTYFQGLLAEILEQEGCIDEGLAMLDAALALADQTAEGLYEAELHRLRGQLLLARGGKSKLAQRQAEEEYREALDIARRQEARSLALRAAVSLGRLYQHQRRDAEIAQLVGPIYGGFAEGTDTPDVQEAETLLSRVHSRK